MNNVNSEKLKQKPVELDLGPPWQLEEIEFFLQRESNQISNPIGSRISTR